MYTCAKQTIQLLQELASLLWSYSCKNLLKIKEGERYLPGVPGCFYTYGMLDPHGLIFYKCEVSCDMLGQIRCRLQFEVSGVLKNEMFLKVKLQSFI